MSFGSALDRPVRSCGAAGSEKANKVARREGKGKERAREDEPVDAGEPVHERESVQGSERVKEEEPMKVDELPWLRHELLPPLPVAAPALPTPALTPFASTSSFSFAFPPSPTQSSTPQTAPCPQTPVYPPSLPTLPVSPFRQNGRTPIPLDRLIPIGTVLLPQQVLNADIPHSLAWAEDGWVDLEKETLKPPSPSLGGGDGEDPVQLDPASPPSSTARSPVKGRKGAGTKRKAASSGRSSAAKKAKRASHPLLDTLIQLTASLAVRGTVRVTSESTAIVRVYLVPQDLPEASDPLYETGRTKRLPGSTVFHLLQEVRVSTREWYGELDEDEAVPSFLEEKDHRSLLEIYNVIESPAHDDAFIDELDAPIEVKHRLRWALVDGAEGVQTEMFTYQKATLAKMLARELAPQPVRLPSYLRFPSILDSAKQVFVSLDGAVRLEPATVTEPRGGILAEDMGVGKTLITLALVLSTLNELPKLDGVSTYDDGSFSSPPVLLTKVSTEFPFPDEINEARKLRPRIPEPLAGYIMEAKEEQEYLAARAREAEEEARVATYPLPSLRSLMVHKIKTSTIAIRYPLDDVILNETGILQLLQESPPFYRVFPSPQQFDSREGRKGRLKPREIVVAATTLIVVPTDLVKQWVDEIHKHVAPDALRLLVLRTSKDKFRTAAEMATFDMILMSTARFADAAEATETALRGMHFKRLVVDEGHVLALGNRVRKLAEGLRCESRWAVSGTPTTNLRGAHEEGQQGALFASASPAGGDRVDLDRLGQLMSRFVRHPAFPRPDSLRKLVQTHVHGGGERPYRLLSVFSRSVLRHHHSLVKDSFVLPPLTSRVVYIELEEAERKIYNALVALFASNSITSQRVDQDYLFHPGQAKHLATLTANLATSTVFFSSSEFIGQLVDSRNYIEKRLNSKSTCIQWTAEERQGLEKVVQVYDEVMQDRECGVMAEGPSVAMEVDGFPTDLRAPFSVLSASKNPAGRSVLPQGQLVRLLVNLKELRREDVKAWDDDEELVEELITLEDKRKRLDTVLKGHEPPEELLNLFKKRSKKDQTPLVALPDDSVLKQIQLVRTTSAKVNYIVSELLRHPHDKFIIFSSALVDVVFANISETLDLLGIRHSIFAGHSSKGKERGEVAREFNATTAKERQAILVDAKLGGRGFTLTAASRIIFCEPEWRPDLEVQAIKRAHRLGQTKPVDVQVLVVKNSYEDALLQRRSKIAPADFAKRVKLPQQDRELASLLQAAQYVQPSKKAKEGKIVSPKFDPPIRLVRD
ncbi:hypothetical protein JCM8547_008012 [Rhodosporidiobolus lusitaniae]